MSKQKILAVAVIWLVVLSIGAYVTKTIWFPAKKQQLLDETGSATQYQHHLVMDADDFAGLCVLYSPEFHAILKEHKIKLTINSEPDFTKRVENLRDKKTQLAAVTIDSLVSACAGMNDMPATIAMIFDESIGADGLVGFDSVKSISDLNSPDAKFVLTPNSPSDFISRVAIAEFSLPNLPADCIIQKDGSQQVFEFLKSNKNKKYAFALWEPYLSQALEMDGCHDLLNTTKLSGYVVDVLAFERQFLKENSEIARTVVEAYQRASFLYSKQDDVVRLLRQTNKQMSEAQAKTAAAKIRWKTTIENYAHFGLQTSSVPHIEDMIINIAHVLIQTGAIPASNVVAGKESNLFYGNLLAEMQSNGFHPAKKTNLLGINNDLGLIRGSIELPALTEQEWGSLISVGDIKTDTIIFGRGTAKLNVKSERELRKLADRLHSMPEYYLLVVGHAMPGGNADANKKLANDRSSVVMSYLRDLGVSENRVRATWSNGSIKVSSVTFSVKQRAY